MKNDQKSEAYQKNNIKAILNFGSWLHDRHPALTFFQLDQRETILKYLDTKIKPADIDPEQKWITTWNDYCDRIKVFFRWLHNVRAKEKQSDVLPMSLWETPPFIKITHKKSKRVSPYTADETWELDEIKTILKYETNPRNKAAITMFWDFDARNKEVTSIEIRNIRLKEKYAEGEIPYQTKTGGGPLLLTVSFPYVRDWLNLHPLKDYPKAKLICDMNTGKPLNPDRMWSMMKQLKDRIQKLVKEGQIRDEKERERLEYLLKTKKWNPYCFRHSAITRDAYSLPEFLLRKKVRWTINSRQPARYVKNKWTVDMQRAILSQNGIETDGSGKPKVVTSTCAKCQMVNGLDIKYCIKCNYPLSLEAYEETKQSEKKSVEDMVEKKIQEILGRVDFKKLTTNPT
jgi:hypothetical protein